MLKASRVVAPGVFRLRQEGRPVALAMDRERVAWLRRVRHNMDELLQGHVPPCYWRQRGSFGPMGRLSSPGAIPWALGRFLLWRRLGPLANMSGGRIHLRWMARDRPDLWSCVGRMGAVAWNKASGAPLCGETR